MVLTLCQRISAKDRDCKSRHIRPNQDGDSLEGACMLQLVVSFEFEPFT